jgi:hypothetical protein
MVFDRIGTADKERASASSIGFQSDQPFARSGPGNRRAIGRAARPLHRERGANGVNPEAFEHLMRIFQRPGSIA